MNIKVKTFFFKLIAIGFGLLIGLFLAECGVRYYWYGSDGFSYSRLNSFKPLGFSGLMQRAENDSILWELQPNLDTLFKFKDFSTNSLGMRDREYSIKKPANTKRIVVIGDSFAMGSGVSNTENYPALIEQMFANEGDSVNIEVLNFGVGGYGLRNYVAVLNEKAMAYDPDLVIIGFCGGNDFLLPQKKHLEGKLRLRPPLEMFYRSHLRRFFIESARKEKQISRLVPIPSKNQTEHMSAHFQAILRQCAPKEIPVMVAYYSLVASQEVIDYMQNLTESQRLHFVSAGASLENTPISEQIFHPLDGHPNAMVHAVYARNIYNYIVANGLLTFKESLISP